MSRADFLTLLQVRDILQGSVGCSVTEVLPDGNAGDTGCARLAGKGLLR